ncbi:MAG: methyltransferase domain-containing protein [Actinomycetota bacterium]
MPREWDAAGYDTVATPMTRRGVALLDRLPLDGAETVVDAGCGTGRVTEALLARLPRGSVVAVDASRHMLRRAAERLGGDPRVTFLHADLAAPLPLPAPVDAIVSTSALHWVADHDRLFRDLAAVLAPGGRLVAELGGAGNVAAILAALSDLGPGEGPWTFPTVDDTRRRLAAAGLAVDDVALVPRPVRLPPDELPRYLRAVALGPFLDPLDGPAADRLVEEVARRMPGGVVDFVRLEVVARRPGG